MFSPTNADVVAFLMKLKNAGSSKSTVNRKLSSIRIYYDFLMKKAGLAINPADNIKSPKIEKKVHGFSDSRADQQIDGAAR